MCLFYCGLLCPYECDVGGSHQYSLPTVYTRSSFAHTWASNNDDRFTKTRRCYEILGLALTGNFVSYSQVYFLSFDCEVKLVFHVIKCHSYIFVHEWLAPSNVITFSPKCNKPPMQSFNSFNALLLWRTSTLRCWSDSSCTEKPLTNIHVTWYRSASF